MRSWLPAERAARERRALEEELATLRRRVELVTHAVREEAVIARRSRADLAALMARLEAALEESWARGVQEEEKS